MSEPNTTAVTTPEVPATYKMSIEETVNELHKYDKQAESSMAQLQTNIDNSEKQINEWRRVQLMIAGQRALLKDLISKTVEVTAPANTTTTATK